MRDPRFPSPAEEFREYRYTGPALADELGAGEKVINVYPGHDLFRWLIPDLTSVDLDGNPDFCGTLAEYAATSQVSRFNTALMFDCMTYVDESTLNDHIKLLSTRLLRTRDSKILWRCVPAGAVQGCYPWTFDEHVRLAELHGFELTTAQWDSNQRVFALWTSLNRSAA